MTSSSCPHPLTSERAVVLLTGSVDCGDGFGFGLEPTIRLNYIQDAPHAQKIMPA